MPKQEITSGLVGRDRYEVGQRVCITGRGTAATLHAHGTVTRFTTTLMVVTTDGSHGGTRRWRTDGRGYGVEVGGGGYGGSYVHPTCQRSRKES